MKTYTTISGDTWDMIAYRVYRNELWADKLMQANAEYLEYMVFPAGIVLNIPEEAAYTDVETSGIVPEWRAALNG